MCGSGEQQIAKGEERFPATIVLMKSAIIGAAGAAAVATWAGFHTMWPTSQRYGSTFIGLPCGSRRLALTYDDGPNDPYTLRLLEILEQHRVKATFFLIGRFVEQKPDIARAIVDAGHAVGNHSWDHPNLIFAAAAEVRNQVERTQRAIFDATGVTPKLFRPPFGGRRPATLRVARALGLQPIMWNVSCYDWKPLSTEEIVRHATRQIRGGDVILLHDGGHGRMGVDRSRSLEATCLLIARYKDQGYEFMTVPEMTQK